MVRDPDPDHDFSTDHYQEIVATIRRSHRTLSFGEVHALGEVPKLNKQKKHTIEVVVDRLTVKSSSRQRLTDSVETALGLAGGVLVVEFVDREADDPERERRFKQNEPHDVPSCRCTL